MKAQYLYPHLVDKGWGWANMDKQGRDVCSLIWIYREYQSAGPQG